MCQALKEQRLLAETEEEDNEADRAALHGDEDEDGLDADQVLYCNVMYYYSRTRTASTPTRYIVTVTVL